jgi:hypothetical protein
MGWLPHFERSDQADLSPDFGRLPSAHDANGSRFESNAKPLIDAGFSRQSIVNLNVYGLRARAVAKTRAFKPKICG